MIPFFNKPLELVTLADVDELLTRAWPEGPDVEYKETLPDKKGGPAPWMHGKNEIGEYARDEVLAELVAFANAQGGAVVLGVGETNDEPPRAASINPLPRIGELARRFEDQARSCIDPPLARLQVHPVITDQDGSGGLLVLRTGASRSAPHRLTTTRDCYVRRGSSTVRMTMREIQEMTLNVARGLSAIEESFSGRHAAFNSWIRQRGPVGGLRLTAVPLEPMPDPGRLFNKPDLFPELKEFRAMVGASAVSLQIPVHAWHQRPIIRGVARYHQDDGLNFRMELYQTGLADLWFSVVGAPHPAAPTGSPAQLRLYHSWMLGAVANLLSLVECYRTHVGAPDAEFGLEAEVDRLAPVDMPMIYIGLFGDRGHDHYEMSASPILLPRLSVGPAAEFNTLVKIIDTDMFDAVGSRRVQSAPIEVTW